MGEEPMRIHDPEIDSQLQEFFADPKLPLYVHLYEDGDTREWEIYYDKEPTCGYTIAAFTTWREAFNWAYYAARWAHECAEAIPRRWNYCYRPDGTWGGFGYWEPLATDASTDYTGTTTTTKEDR